MPRSRAEQNLSRGLDKTSVKGLLNPRPRCIFLFLPKCACQKVLPSSADSLNNKTIIHIQEQIMNDLKSLKTIQRSPEKSHKRGYVRYISYSRRTYNSEIKKGYVSSSTKSSPDRSPVRYKKRRFTRDELVGVLRRIKAPTFDGEVK